MLVGEVAARLAAAVLEVREAAAVEERGRLAALGALEGLHEAVVEAVVTRAHPAGLAHRGRMRAGPPEVPDLSADRTSPELPAPADPLHPGSPLAIWGLVVGVQPSRASSALSPPPVHMVSGRFARPSPSRY